jgi:MoaA/NifB/PqqE/SkfB family radical SAM enzyme
MGLLEIERVFAHLPQMDVVRLTGGEPFMRQDITEIAHLVQEKLQPLILHITTNGLLTERIVDFCEKRRKDIPLHLLVSVDGVGEKHNQVRGRSSAWDSAVRTLEVLSPRQKELRLSLTVNQTIVDSEGLSHYRGLRAFLRPLGIRNHVVLAYDVSATYNLRECVNVAPTDFGQFETFGEFGQGQLDDLLKEAIRDLRDYPFFEGIAKRYYLEGIRGRLLGRDGYPNPKCVALSAHLRLLPDGLVPTCQFNSVSVGNLRQQSFQDLWFGSRIQKQRDWVRNCPGCWAECEVFPNALYTADLAKMFVMQLPTSLLQFATRT